LTENGNPSFWGGALAVIFGFTLTLLWEIWKRYVDVRRKEQSIEKAIEEEIASNREVLSDNNELIIKELDLINKKQFLNLPLSQLAMFSWQLITMNIPKRFQKNKELFTSIRNLFHIVQMYNGVIENRESYKLNNNAMTNYLDKVKSYDQTILTLAKAVLTAIIGFESLNIEKKRRHSPVVFERTVRFGRYYWDLIISKR
jgi:hypothetical protein